MLTSGIGGASEGGFEVEVQTGQGVVFDTHEHAGSLVNYPVDHEHVGVVELRHSRRLDREQFQVVQVRLVTAPQAHRRLLVLRVEQNRPVLVATHTHAPRSQILQVVVLLEVTVGGAT